MGPVEDMIFKMIKNDILGHDLKANSCDPFDVLPNEFGIPNSQKTVGHSAR